MIRLLGSLLFLLLGTASAAQNTVLRGASSDLVIDSSPDLMERRLLDLTDIGLQLGVELFKELVGT